MSSVGLLVAIDTNVLIWGIRRDGSQGEVQRADWLFKQLDEEEAQIIVPTIVLAEYIRPYHTPEKRTEHIAECQKRFLLMPFDVKAASISARLFNKGREQREMGKEGCRNKLNADSMIIATAAAHGAQRIYSANDDFRTLAKVLTHWKVEDLPINSGKLFE